MATAELEARMDFPVEGLCEAGEDADAALAKLMQEQEHAWFLANGGSVDHFGLAASDSEELARQHDHDSSAAATSSDSNAAPRDGDGAAAAPQHTDDADVAFEAQREEYRANLRTMLQMLGNMAEEQLEASAADVDGMSYEELQALGETIGKVTVGVSKERLAALPRLTYQEARQRGMCVEDKCTVCQEQYEESDVLLQLPCKHCFHAACIEQWLQGSRMCPVCMSEVEEGAAQGEGGAVDAACAQEGEA